MKTFYIANDDFNAVGHSRHTLRSLCSGSDDPVVLLTQPQAAAFKATLPPNCTVAEFLPTSDVGRNISPTVLGAEIAEKLLENGIASDDLIVLKMPFPYLLLSVVYAFSLSRVSEVNPRLSILISQTDDGYAYEEIKYSNCFRIIENLPPRFRDRVALLHEREALRQHWQRQFPTLRMDLCGYVNEWFNESVAASDDGNSPTTYRLTYLGEARAEKGFNTLAEIVSANGLRCDVDVHCDANSNNMTDLYYEAMRKFEECGRQSSNIRLIHQRAQNCYDAAFHPHSVALMLYSPEYGLRGSGVLQECAAAGMHVIAYSDLDFHLDFPDNVLTVARTSDMAALGRDIQSCMDRIVAGERPAPQPNVLTAAAFRELLTRPHQAPASADGRFVFVVSNNVHRQGCSRIIEAQQEEILSRGMTPVFISFEWPCLEIDWSESVAFSRIWKMQMNSKEASYGEGFLTIPLIAQKKILSRYDTFHYKQLVDISKNVDGSILDGFLSWRKDPVVVMNYVHHAPILEGKLASFDRTFLEIHDLLSYQQSIRTSNTDPAVFEENLSAEIGHLNKFRYKKSLSPNEAEFLATKGCSIGDHSYLDVFVRQAGRKAPSHPTSGGMGFDEYLCIVGSDHPSNVMGINQFCEKEVRNSERSLPILICGLICQKISVSHEALKGANIHLVGFVDDVGEFMRASIATLNPVDIGSGTPIKVLDSIAYETPCLATKRTVVAMPPHPLVVEFDFDETPIRDENIRKLAADARSRFQQGRGAGLIAPNKLGEFLDECCPC